MQDAMKYLPASLGALKAIAWKKNVANIDVFNFVAFS